MPKKIDRSPAVTWNPRQLTKRACLLGLAALGGATEQVMAGRAADIKNKDTFNRVSQKATPVSQRFALAPSPSTPPSAGLHFYESDGSIGDPDGIFAAPQQTNFSALYQAESPVYEYTLSIQRLTSHSAGSAGLFCHDFQFVPFTYVGIDIEHGPERHGTICTTPLFLGMEPLVTAIPTQTSPLNLLKESIGDETVTLDPNTYLVKPNQVLRIYTEVLRFYKLNADSTNAMVDLFYSQLQKEGIVDYLHANASIFAPDVTSAFNTAFQAIVTDKAS